MEPCIISGRQHLMTVEAADLRWLAVLINWLLAE